MTIKAFLFRASVEREEYLARAEEKDREVEKVQQEFEKTLRRARELVLVSAEDVPTAPPANGGEEV